MLGRLKRKKEDQTDEVVSERLTAAVMNAIEAGEDQVERAVSSPFLYSRLRVSIAEEEKRRREIFNRWAVWRRIAWQAIPALVIVAAATFGLARSSPRTSPDEVKQLAASELNPRQLDGAVDGADGADGAERASGAQAIMIGFSALSSDELLRAMVSSEERH